jgi:hypothetical protein
LFHWTTAFGPELAAADTQRRVASKINPAGLTRPATGMERLWLGFERFFIQKSLLVGSALRVDIQPLQMEMIGR